MRLETSGEPDHRHFDRFRHVIVPHLLTEVRYVGGELAARTGEDILARVESYAALDDTARDVLIAPSSHSEPARALAPRFQSR